MRNSDADLTRTTTGTAQERSSRLSRRRFIASASIVALTTIPIHCLAIGSNIGEAIDDGSFFSDGTGWVD